MHKKQNNIIKKDLVLLGAGHSNIEVIRYFGKLKLEGLRITLISKHTHTTYSGMVPGYIEGEYQWNDINVDLVKLCYRNDIKIIIGEVTKVLGEQKKVFLKNRPPIEFDFLAVNLGIKSKTENIIGANKFALSLKPISEINKILKNILASKSKNIVIVGAGAAGVEVSLALKKRLIKTNVKKNIILIAKGNSLMKSYNQSVSKKLNKELKKNNIQIRYNSSVTKIKKNYIEINNKDKVLSSCTLLATNASAPDVLKKSDLSLSINGFIEVTRELQSKNFKYIFASGDIADIENLKLVKAGIYAVKQAKILKVNLRNFFLKKELKCYLPQKSYLSLIGTANGKAIANKSILTLRGTFFWKLKKFIDRRFINKYSVIGFKENNLDQIKSTEPIDYAMQCNGCGSKVPQNVIKNIFSKNYMIGSNDADLIYGTKDLVHTVDVITSLIDDDYLMGRIAAKHSLNDLIAANSYLVSTQMMLGVPKSSTTIQKRCVYQIKEGALSIFKEFNIKINGGHTYSVDDEKSTVGFSLIGKMKNRFTKNNKDNNKLKIYMTGKVGTALVIAALRQNKISGKYYHEVIKEMTKSNFVIYEAFKKYNITDITDISGFGLALHLKNLLIRNKRFKGANIYLDKIMILKGAIEAMKCNVLSSLSYSNKSNLNNYLEIKSNKNDILDILFDPQTAAGFLFITSNKKIIQDFRNKNLIFSEIGEISDSHNKIRVL
ncbi:MAG: Selenide, water dikinase [Alphaproteobacteria bacterium MarineAlpha9_Bin4]|nr:selenide, water dikinase SelD [Pelagibacterales bacterium]PPR26759.1 MAG: Selenide, water dikinase [Alphaproteobacteria bacterium MarineAlpha9_Bin4]